MSPLQGAMSASKDIFTFVRRQTVESEPPIILHAVNDARRSLPGFPQDINPDILSGVTVKVEESDQNFDKWEFVTHDESSPLPSIEESLSIGESPPQRMGSTMPATPLDSDYSFSPFPKSSSRTREIPGADVSEYQRWLRYKRNQRLQQATEHEAAKEITRSAWNRLTFGILRHQICIISKQFKEVRASSKAVDLLAMPEPPGEATSNNFHHTKRNNINEDSGSPRVLPSLRTIEVLPRHRRSRHRSGNLFILSDDVGEIESARHPPYSRTERAQSPVMTFT
ncbi:hypothetical protein CSIM01_02799 [Colletotrichum simmondsii]|uniref:Uncharacterized protein n=1 Tax=Colletotrichum simmondsii TaxID=703756 RepID=A0A135T1D4_9PEZI|nr:hypothetical protein CSIM01_02799 [Colletotrichum simmondsii]